MALDAIRPPNSLVESMMGTGLTNLANSGAQQATVIADAAAATADALTDNSGGSASTTIASLASLVDIPITLPDILLTSVDTPADLVTDYIPGVAGDIVRWGFVTQIVATDGGSSDIDLDLQIGATPVTGAAFAALAVADFNVIGKVKQSAALSAANTITTSSTISIVCTESTANFTAGLITPIIWVRLPMAALSNAIASLAAEYNELLTDVADIRTQLNAALAALKTANLMASA